MLSLGHVAGEHPRMLRLEPSTLPAEHHPPPATYTLFCLQVTGWIRFKVRVFPYRTNFSAGIPTPDIEFMFCPHLLTTMRSALPASVLGLVTLVVGCLVIIWESKKSCLES